MIRILIFLIQILLFTEAITQEFEGLIIYNIEYKSKTENISTEQLTTMMGSEQHYYYKDGNYKSEINGTMMQWQLFDKEENKLYSKMSNSETIFWNDVSQNKDSIIEIKINKDVKDILGYPCNELILIKLKGSEKYYFNSQMKVDPSHFKAHLYGNWYNFLKNSKSLPLKIIVENEQFILESTAKEVKKEKVESNKFRLPENVAITKSPY